MTLTLSLDLGPPGTDTDFLSACARLRDVLTALAGHVATWAGGLAAVNPPPGTLAPLGQARQDLTAAAFAAVRAATAFEDEFSLARGTAARGMAITGSGPPPGPQGPGSGPEKGEPAMGTRYTSARAWTCPNGCTGHGTSQIIPEGTGTAPVCMTCRTPLTPSGGPLAGQWETEPCGCIPPPDGWTGPPRDTRTCKYCGGTARRLVCTICLALHCDGVHDLCLACDGSGTVACPRCQGEGTLAQPPRQVTCPGCHGRGCGDCEDTGTVTKETEIRCPDCKGREEAPCPDCKGTGKPPRRKR